jgi:hypothetical protein
MTGQGQRIVLPLRDMALATTSARPTGGRNQVDRRVWHEIFSTFGRTKDGRSHDLLRPPSMRWRPPAVLPRPSIETDGVERDAGR